MEKLSIFILFTCCHLLSGQIFTCDSQPKDVVTILDSSGSIVGSEYDNGKSAIIKLMNALKENSRFAFVQFGSQAELKFNLDPKNTFEEKINMVKNSKHSGGVTAIGKALELVVNKIQPIMEPSSLKLVILITDGTNNKYPQPQFYADKLKNGSVTVICIGIGSDINKEELKRLSSDNGLILINSYGEFLQDFKKVLDNMCFQPDPIPFKPCFKPQQDLLFIIDSSASLSEDDYKNSKELVKSFISKLKLGPDDNRVAMLSFSQTPRIDFNIDSYTDIKDYIRVINKAEKFGSLTAIGKALVEAYNTIWPKHRASVPFNIILVTDGQNNKYPDPKQPAAVLKQSGAFIVTVGIGSDINFDELKEISSNNHFITFQNYTELATNLKSVEKIVSCG